MEVEFLRALEDNTWDTITVTVPEDELNEDLVGDSQYIAWAQDNLAGLAQHRDVVLFAIYSIPPTEGPNG